MNLQELVNTASSFATIQHDGEFVGNLIINKPLTIQGSGIIRSPNAGPAVDVVPKTGPVSLLGKSLNELLKITHTTMVYDIIRWGAWQTTSLADVPQGLSMEFCDVYGQPTENSQRGIAANGANFSFKNGKVREIHWYKGEAQGICAWNGPGPFKILDSYIEASTENILFGGADAYIPNLIPSDIEIRRCHLFKPMAWRGAWSCKNILELKNARRAVIDGNKMENCWGDGQIGFGVLFTTRNQDGGNPWAVVEDVEYTNNELLNVAGGFQVIGKDYPNVSAQGSRIRIANNLIRLAQGGALGPNGRLLQMERTKDVTFENNDANPDHTFIVFSGEDPQPGLIYRRNLLTYGEYGITPAGLLPKDALTKYAPGHDFSENMIIASWNPSSRYPAGNTFVTSRPDPVPAGVGVDLVALKAAQDGATTQPLPTPSPAPTPTPTPEPEPAPAPSTPSPNGTKAATIVDAGSKVWTIGPSKETLRDGSHVASGLGTVYKWQDSVVYVLGTDENWWKFNGSGWEKYGATEPGTTAPTPEPIPEPAPTPAPTPACTITGPDSINVSKNGLVTINLNVSNVTEPVTVTHTGSDGQVMVTPASRTATVSSNILAFQVRVKKQSRTIVFNSPCGSKSVKVNVL